jgi:transposase
VAIDDGERPLGEVKVRASARQAKRLLDWAAPFPARTWAIEGAGGLGYLLAQQLVAAGERVVDVPPKLAARVRLLGSGESNKNDPNDARSVAVAALRSRTLKEVHSDDHVAVMRVWAKRNNDLGRARNKTACRLHSVLCELVPGGIAGEITAARAADLLDRFEPAGAIETARRDLALELLDDLHRVDDQMPESKKRIAEAVTASGTTLTELFGVGPVVAALIIGYTGDVARFPTRDRYASYTGTAPIEISSGPRKVHRVSRRGNRQLNHAIHIVAVTQIRFPHSHGRAFFDRKVAQGKTPKEALRALKRRISDALYRQLHLDAQQATTTTQRTREGKQGTTPKPARPALTLNTGSSAKPLPGPTSPYDNRPDHDRPDTRRIHTDTRRRRA